MDLTTLEAFLLRCTLINGGLLVFWTLFCTWAPNLVYRTQRAFFAISQEDFTRLIYGYLGLFKILFLMLNLVPYLAILMIK